MRGLALLLVVLFHLFGGGRVSGGVDVFLVVSGFLVTGSLVRRAETGSLRLGSVYARNLARLAPPALVVLAAVAVAAWTLLPTGRWLEIWRQVIASGLYVENWDLIANTLSYGAAGPAVSPLQHFWSLSVQGQFLLAWPLVVLVVAWLCRRARTGVRRQLVVLVALASATSFAYALYLTQVLQPTAYFHTGTRFWELGVGALLALVPLRGAGGLRALGAWAGLGLIVSSGFLLDGGTLFPGPWTLWPVTGALLVLAGAGTTVAWGPRRLLELAPLRFVADISYELYLWHWPVLIFYLALRGFPAVGVRGAALVLAASLVLAWVTRQLVARPVGLALPRTMGPARAGGTLLAAGVATALVVVPTFAASVDLRNREVAALEALQHLGPAYTGAQALAAPRPRTTPNASHTGNAATLQEAADEMPVRPDPELAKTDETRVDHNQECVQVHGDGPGLDQVRMCTLHDPAEPTRTVLVAGGSHTYQWAAAVNRVARENGWRVLVAGKGQCRLMYEPVPTDDCGRWSANVLAAAGSLDPDAVFVTGSRTHEDRREFVVPVEVAAWQQLDAVGIPVVTIRDNPRFRWSPPNCVRDNGRDAARCATDRSDVFAERNPVQTFPGMPASAGHVDLSDALCEPRSCPPVVGNVMVYRDGSHLTATYLRSLTPALDKAVRQAAPWLY
ncbi:acyltransferase family protein [Promicromonospora iranensis]|uniref:Peptidoglycan/LPS O-acetylase OafA/YrhL n=1 Tax=Promicromonospora iranensis TaxID=1105144 RepID=A0ABU2CNF0_9MICO|nr:acyltransferase family protein [Promicromonospora iranensis]MDR7382865.1 peptidoglycan/LPS O-acetylase OafA/YrhL [Promicromonospora iranensis]